MNITKDEARILAAVLDNGKYDLINMMESKDAANKLASKLELLENRLLFSGKDRRRLGRKSLNGLSDVVKRY